MTDRHRRSGKYPCLITTASSWQPHLPLFFFFPYASPSSSCPKLKFLHDLIGKPNICSSQILLMDFFTSQQVTFLGVSSMNETELFIVYASLSFSSPRNTYNFPTERQKIISFLSSPYLRLSSKEACVLVFFSSPKVDIIFCEHLSQVMLG